MRELDARAFASLFREAHQKCFGSALTTPLTESESLHFSVEIAERTGLEIGWKSLKNYSQYLLAEPQGKPENPSTATLDILARYLAEAPATDQGPPRKGARHYPYWFRYKEAFHQAERQRPNEAPPPPRRDRSAAGLAVALGTVLVALLLLVILTRRGGTAAAFRDDFDTVTDSALAGRGWWVRSIDSAHWAERGAKPGYLTLFTLRGDNWPYAGTAPTIKNLLVRKTASRCYVAELRLTAFFPRQNWQQAGMLVMEDTALAGKSLRLSLGFNAFAGGFPETPEIIVQAITSLGREASKPEEIVHQRLFVVEPATEDVIRGNLAHSALRIEQRGTRLRLLYSAGPMENSAFKEVGTTEFDLRSAYVAVFALKGFVSQPDDMPVYVDGFSLADSPCDR
jgi:hypothetical protein